MKLKKQYVILALIFIITLSLRLNFAFQTEQFDYDGYLVLRQVESIKETGSLIYYDDLSYNGHKITVFPGYYYILGFFNLFMSLELVGKLIPNIFASLLVIVVYLISNEITKDKNISLFASLISGFIPVFFSETINNLSPLSIMIPLSFLLVYLFIKFEEHLKYIKYFVFIMAISIFIHPSILILILSLFCYLILISIESEQKKTEIEAVVFSIFFFLWFSFLILKEAFLDHGAYIVWQNIPTQILTNVFKRITVLEGLYSIGFIPFVFGTYIIYKYTFRESKKRSVFLLVGVALTTVFLLWFKLILLETGMMFLGVTLLLLFSQFCKVFFDYTNKTKMSYFKKIFVIIFLLIIISTSIIPSYTYAKKVIRDSPTNKEVEASLWLKNNVQKDSKVLATLEEGYLISYFSERSNIWDRNFLFIENSDQIYKDVNGMFTTNYETEAIRLVNKYQVDYIYFSNKAKEYYNVNELKYTENKECFELVFDNGVKIFKPKCILEEI